MMQDANSNEDVQQTSRTSSRSRSPSSSPDSSPRQRYQGEGQQIQMQMQQCSNALPLQLQQMENAMPMQMQQLPPPPVSFGRPKGYGKGVSKGKGKGTHSFRDDDDIEATRVTTVEPQPEEEVLSSGPLSISTRLEYTSLKKDEMHNVFGLVSLQAAEAAQLESDAAEIDQRTPVDVVCVLDVSSSMSGRKIQLLKDAVAFVIGEMQPSDRLSIVSFNHLGQRLSPLKKMTQEGKDVSQQTAMRLIASGGTSIASVLDCGIAVMEQRRQRNPVGAVFLLTDGQDSTSRDQIQQLVGRARAAHCSVYAFGFGEDHDTAILNAIAESAQTPFTYVERLDTIRNVFAGAVNGLMSVAAQGIELRIMPEIGCTLAAIHTPFTHTSNDDGSAVVLIPDAFEGERRDIVIELRVPAASVEGSVALLSTSAKYLAVREQATIQTPQTYLHAQRTSTAEPEGEPDAEVVEQRQRVEVTTALESAIAQGEQGHFDKAQEVLAKSADVLRQSRAQTNVSRALLAEVQDAQDRLKDERAWRHGGQAEVTNAMCMHKQQRCTTTDESVSAFQKCSKSLYANSRQKAAISRSSMY